jgi:hypothetical protein
VRYRRPTDDEAIDSLTKIEFDVARTETNCIARGRAKAWKEWREVTGPTARLRSLALSDKPGVSILFTEYKSTPAMGYILARVGGQERVRFSSRVERSLVDGSVIGVRVTLVSHD